MQCAPFLSILIWIFFFIFEFFVAIAKCTDDAQNEVFTEETVENGIYFFCVAVHFSNSSFLYFLFIDLFVSIFVFWNFYFYDFDIYFVFGAWLNGNIADISLINGETHAQDVDEVDGPNGKFFVAILFPNDQRKWVKSTKKNGNCCIVWWLWASVCVCNSSLLINYNSSFQLAHWKMRKPFTKYEIPSIVVRVIRDFKNHSDNAIREQRQRQKQQTLNDVSNLSLKLLFPVIFIHSFFSSVSFVQIVRMRTVHNDLTAIFACPTHLIANSNGMKDFCALVNAFDSTRPTLKSCGNWFSSNAFHSYRNQKMDAPNATHIH